LGITAVRCLAPVDIPYIDQISLTDPVLLFGIALTFSTILLFALGPALKASKEDPRKAFQSTGTRLSATRSQTRMSGALVFCEVALSAVLVICAGLLLRSFAELAHLNAGFNAERILTFRVTLEKPDQESRRAFYTQLLERLRALPGVESAGAILLRPLSGTVGWDTVYSVEGQNPEDIKRNPNANYQAISPAYFGTMGIRLVAGRDFTDADVHTAAAVVIVNESTARRHWPGGSAVGKHVRLGRNASKPWATVVGVVNDVRYREWEATRPDLYVPYMRRAQHRSDFVLKTQSDPSALIAAVTREVLAIDKDQPVSNVTTMQALVDSALARSRFNGLVVGALVACAVILALIGLYGVLSGSGA